jgi:hypothetical protein
MFHQFIAIVSPKNDCVSKMTTCDRNFGTIGAKDFFLDLKALLETSQSIVVLAFFRLHKTNVLQGPGGVRVNLSYGSFL